MKKIKIRIKVSLAGTGGSWVPGDVVEWDEQDALSLIKAGYAERA